MCGIAGIASIDHQSDRAWLQQASISLIHRGPDEFGEWWSEDERVGMAHRRLSILDLSHLGRQPMHSADGTAVISFNGEIYNFGKLRSELGNLGYVFRTNTDTEVLLNAYAEWGNGCLSRLNGMFAFALYDRVRKILLLARDRAGEKPLYYRLDHNSLFFASELKALLSNKKLPRRLSAEAMDCFLAMGFVPKERCILDGYSKLPPAHALEFDIRRGKTRVWQYWQLPDLQVDTESVSEDLLLDELEELLEDSVARQLVADVPVGVLLSGGVDSSIITALAARRSDRVRTFNIGFPGSSKHDESLHARRIARYFGTEHTELEASPSTAESLFSLFRQFDEPIVDSSMLPTWLVSRAVRSHCAVAIGGDGGDELFGGYKHYNRVLWMHKVCSRLPVWLRSGVVGISSNYLPTGFRGRNYLMELCTDFNNSVPFIAKYFDKQSRKSLMRSVNEQPLVAEEVFMGLVPAHEDMLQRLTRADFNCYLAEDILVKVDRASMLNSLEMRAPMLDPQVIEFAYGQIPSHLKVAGSRRKILLKRLAERLLPEDFDLNRKQGFSIPMKEWLRNGPFRDLFWDTLLSHNCIFDRSTVLDLLNAQDRGVDNGERLFALVQFEIWRNTYSIEL